MRKLKLFVSCLFLSTNLLAQELPLQQLHLPKGFKISLYAYPINDARSMCLGSKDIVFVGTRQEGKIYAIVPDKNAKHGTKVITIAEGLEMPNGVAFYEGALYVAEMSKVLKFENIEKHLSAPPKPKVILDNLPDKTHHGWRFIGLGPDKKLYLSIGAPCNVCLEKDPRFATIVRIDTDGSHFEIYALGVRNSVGFDWHPLTHELWFTDNGRDWMGDNIPPDELNHAPRKGLHFGFPFYHGHTADPDFIKKAPAISFTQPILELPAHVAALGMTFYTGKMFPAQYKNQIFIAEHGSWNRAAKIGYQVISVQLQNNKVVSTKPFISGWLQGEKVWGRPVDVLVMPDGSLLISDDHAGAVYKVSY